MLTTWPYKRPLGHAHFLIIFMTQAEIIWQLRGRKVCLLTGCWSVNVCVFNMWFSVCVKEKYRHDLAWLWWDFFTFFACKSTSMLLLITIWLMKQCQNMAMRSTSDDWYYQNFKFKRIIQWWWWWLWWWKINEMMKNIISNCTFSGKKKCKILYQLIYKQFLNLFRIASLNICRNYFMDKAQCHSKWPLKTTQHTKPKTNSGSFFYCSTLFHPVWFSLLTIYL